MSKAFRKDGSKLQQPDWLARSQSTRTIFDPPNDPGCIYKRLPNHGQQYGMVQSSPQPSNHIATDENRKIPNRGLASKLIFNCTYYVVAQRSQSFDW